MTNIKGVTAAWSVGCGAPLANAGYPAIYMWGKVKKQEGLWRSDDEGRSWTDKTRGLPSKQIQGFAGVSDADGTVLLFMMFGQYRSGSTERYSAVFADASRLKAGDSVRAAGIRVGTVREVTLQAGDQVLVAFDADPPCMPDKDGFYEIPTPGIYKPY